MESDGWPKLQIARFEKEGESEFRARSREISKIVEGFRMGRYQGDVAEFMERRLIQLEERGLDRIAS